VREKMIASFRCDSVPDENISASLKILFAPDEKKKSAHASAV
jgi:hypothetical protein